MEWPSWTHDERMAYEPINHPHIAELYRERDIDSFGQEDICVRYLALEVLRLPEEDIARIFRTCRTKADALNFLELRVIRDYEARRGEPARTDASPLAPPEKI